MITVVNLAAEALDTPTNSASKHRPIRKNNVSVGWFCIAL
jgi:hypothetical protein